MTGFLDTEDAAAITGAIDAEIEAWFRSGLLDGDTRTRGELHAAALQAITERHGLTGDQHGQARPLALILADADTLAGRIPTPGSPNMAPRSPNTTDPDPPPPATAEPPNLRRGKAPHGGRTDGGQGIGGLREPAGRPVVEAGASSSGSALHPAVRHPR